MAKEKGSQFMKQAFLIFLIIIQTSCVLVANRNNKNQFLGDSIAKIEGQIENGDNTLRKKTDRVEYKYISPDIVTRDSNIYYSSYKVVSKDDGANYCLSIFNKEYDISDMMDYGDLNLKVYKRDNSTLLIIGLDDLYESVYFVYHFKENTLVRIGQINIVQPGDVEVHGAKRISFKVYCEESVFIIENYFDNIYENATRFAV